VNLNFCLLSQLFVDLKIFSGQSSFRLFFCGKQKRLEKILFSKIQEEKKRTRENSVKKKGSKNMNVGKNSEKRNPSRTDQID